MNLVFFTVRAVSANDSDVAILTGGSILYQKGVIIMLEQKDFEILRDMMESIAAKNLAAMEARADENLAKMEARATENLAKMEVRAAENLAAVKAECAQNRSDMLQKADENMAKMEALLDKKLTKSEGLILDELERTRNILEKQIQNIQQNVDELNQYYRITRLENSNVSLLLEMYEDLSRRVEALEAKTA